MSASTTMSVRLPQDLADRLERLAKATERTKVSLAVEAIEELVALQEWQVAAIEEGLAAADRGDVAGHADAVALLGRWGRGGAQP